jgi:tetratricopeptide (TPR) repeat protein
MPMRAAHLGIAGATPERYGFVGREHELADLRTSFDKAIAGRGRVVLIAGEPGIGKTRLADELTCYAESNAARVLWSACWEGAGAPAFWPWMQLLQEYAAGTDSDTLRTQLAHGASVIAQLLPELADRWPDLPPLPPLDGDHARFRLFAAVTLLLKNAAARQPLLLVLDDLHWGDAASLRLLGFLARDLRDTRLLAVGTYRTSEVPRDRALTDLLGQLPSESVRLVLGGLNQPEVGRLLALTTGRPAELRLLEATFRATAGNPLFVKELGRLLALRPEAESLVTPDSVRSTIERRIGHLSEACIDLLTTAAVVGPQFGLEVLRAAVTTSSDEHLMTLIEEAMAAGLVIEVSGAVATYRFVHTLIRDVLYEGLGPARRQRLHRRVGEAIEDRFRSDLEPRLAELAHHFTRAAADGETGKAIEYTIRAGERAFGMLAYEEAADQFRRALDVIALEPPVDPRHRGELLLALARAQMSAGQAGAARAAFEQAAALARVIGASDLLAHAALGVVREFTEPAHDPLQVRLLEEALHALDVNPPTQLRARMLARLAKALLFEPSPQRRIGLSNQAVEMARTLNDPQTLAAVLYDHHTAIWGPDTVDDRLLIATEVIALADASGDRVQALKGRLFRMTDLLELGDMIGLLSELQTYEVLANELRQPYFLWQVPLTRAGVALLAGRFDEADALVHQALAVGRQAHDPVVEFMASVVQRHALFLWGRLPEAEQPLRDSIARLPGAPVLRGVLAVLLCQAGRPDEARVEYERLAANGFGQVACDHLRLTNLMLMSVVCRALGDASRAAILYEMLRPYVTRTVTVGQLPLGCVGSVSHYLGLLAGTMARWEDAARHLESAIEVHARIGALPLTTLSRHEHARALRARGWPGDEQCARDVAKLARETAESLGMRLWPEAVPADAPPPSRKALLLKEGEYWTLAGRGPAFRLKDTVGLRYLARLLQAPGREFHALDLAAAEPAVSAGLGDAGAVLDPQAKAAYRARLADLAVELEQAARWNDYERVARLRSETDAITEQLVSAVGLRGRDRRSASHAERARSSVSKALRATVSRIAEQDPALGDHLRRTIRTGLFCAYDPDPAASFSWAISI